MANITIAGRAVDSDGNGINGIPVEAYSTGTTTPVIGSTTTANHPDWSTDAGYWTLTLTEDIYRIVIGPHNGVTREVYGGIRPQFGSVTVGNYGAFQVDKDGNVSFRSPEALTDNDHTNSPSITFTGKYDSDVAADSIVEATRSMTTYLVLDNSGNYRLTFVENDGTTEVAAINQNGIPLFGAQTAVPANGKLFAEFSKTAGLGLYIGTGSPNGALTAAKGSLYMRTDGSSASTRLYVNTDNGTTWTNFTSAA